VKKKGDLVPHGNGAHPKSIGPVDLGCGLAKRTGYLGVDRLPLPGVDVVCDVTAGLLPFPDDSLVGIYSNFLFQELENPLPLLREIVRVCKHGADVQIWVPHGRCDVATLPGTRSSYTDVTWTQLVGQTASPRGGLAWEQVWYIISEQTQSAFAAQKIPLEFGVSYMSNVVHDFGVLLRVDKRGTYTGSGPVRTAAAQRTRPEIG
jgi:SAM-dependent methyltransferase